MAQSIKTPDNVVERNLRLTGEIMRYLMTKPEIFDSLPDKFALIILPDDDPDLRIYNLDLLDQYGTQGRPVVLARLKVNQPTKTSLFVPLTVAA